MKLRTAIWRVLSVNGIQSCRELAAMAAGGSRRTYQDQLGLLYMLAEIAGLQVDLFVHAHTVAPLIHSVWTKKTVEPFEQRRRLAMRLPRGQLFKCEQCFGQDQKKYGTGYLRRIHQIPGITACPLHRHKLTVEVLSGYALGMHSGDPERMHPLEPSPPRSNLRAWEAINRYGGW